MHSILRNFFEKSILNNIYKSILFKGLTILGQLYLIPLTINVLNKESFGVWVTISTIINWITFFDFGIGNSLRNKLVESESKKNNLLSKKYITAAYAFVSFVCISIGVCFFVFDHFYSINKIFFNESQSNDSINKGLFIAVFLFLIRFVLMTITYINFAFQNSSRNDWLQLCNIVLVIGSIIILRNKMRLDLISIIIIYSTIPILVYTIYSILFFLKHNRLKPSFKTYDRKIMPSLMNMGLSFFIIQGVSMVLFTFPVLLIGKWYGSQQVTDYNIANRLYGVLYMGLSIILVPYWSAFTKASTEKNIQWIKANVQKIQLLSLFFVGILVSFYIFSAPIFSIWVGKSIKIESSLNLSAALFNLALILIAPLNYYLNGRSLLRIQLYLCILNIIIYFPLTFLLCQKAHLGAPGIVYSSVFIILANYLFTFFFVNRSFYGSNYLPA